MTTSNYLTITRHAIDQASKRCLHLWPQTDEGLFSWVERSARSGLDAILANLPAGVSLDTLKYDVDGMTFVVKDNKVVTIYLTQQTDMAA